MSDSIMRVKVPYRLLTSENQVASSKSVGAISSVSDSARAARGASWHMRLGQLVVTPSFWADTSLLSTALLPLSFLVSAGVPFLMRLAPFQWDSRHFLSACGYVPGAT